MFRTLLILTVHLLFLLVIHGYQLSPREHVTSLTSCVLDSTHYYAVGTAFVDPTEKEPNRGRVLLFRVSHTSTYMFSVSHTITYMFQPPIPVHTCFSLPYQYIHVFSLPYQYIHVSVSHTSTYMFQSPIPLHTCFILPYHYIHVSFSHTSTYMFQSPIPVHTCFSLPYQYMLHLLNTGTSLYKTRWDCDSMKHVCFIERCPLFGGSFNVFV